MSDEDQRRLDALIEKENQKVIDAFGKSNAEKAEALKIENTRKAQEEITSKNLFGHERLYYQILKKHGQPIPENILNTWPDLK